MMRRQDCVSSCPRSVLKAHARVLDSCLLMQARQPQPAYHPSRPFPTALLASLSRTTSRTKPKWTLMPAATTERLWQQRAPAPRQIGHAKIPLVDSGIRLCRPCLTCPPPARPKLWRLHVAHPCTRSPRFLCKVSFFKQMRSSFLFCDLLEVH